MYLTIFKQYNFLLVVLVKIIVIVIQNLKQSKGENDILKAKNNRLEDEVLAKSKKIDELLNPETQV